MHRSVLFESELNEYTCTMACSGPSCEFRRMSFYSEDLKWRMVWQRECLGKKCSEVAINLIVDATTISRIVARFAKEELPFRQGIQETHPCLEFMIIHLILMRPGILQGRQNWSCWSGFWLDHFSWAKY